MPGTRADRRRGNAVAMAAAIRYVVEHPGCTKTQAGKAATGDRSLQNGQAIVRRAIANGYIVATTQGTYYALQVTPAGKRALFYYGQVPA